MNHTHTMQIVLKNSKRKTRVGIVVGYNMLITTTNIAWFNKKGL